MSMKLFKTISPQKQNRKPEAETPELFIVTRTKNSYVLKQVICFSDKSHNKCPRFSCLKVFILCQVINP